MTEKERLDREMAFSVQQCANFSCMDPNPNLMECRRLRGHDGEHAAGYGPKRLRW